MYTVFQFGNITYAICCCKDRDLAATIWPTATSQSDFEAKMTAVGIDFSRKQS
jgi:hypothetical protein